MYVYILYDCTKWSIFSLHFIALVYDLKITTSSDSEPMVKWAFMIKICMCGLVFLSHFRYGRLSINLGSTCKFSYIKGDTSYIEIQQNYLEHKSLVILLPMANCNYGGQRSTNFHKEICIQNIFLKKQAVYIIF